MNVSSFRRRWVNGDTLAYLLLLLMWIALAVTLYRWRSHYSDEWGIGRGTILFFQYIAEVGIGVPAGIVTCAYAIKRSRKSLIVLAIIVFSLGNFSPLPSPPQVQVFRQYQGGLEQLIEQVRGQIPPSDTRLCAPPPQEYQRLISGEICVSYVPRAGSFSTNIDRTLVFAN
jgi:hypothetical protein